MDSTSLSLPESKPTTRIEPPVSLGRDHPLRFIESLIDPGALVLSLWGVGLFFEGTLPP